MNDELQDLRNAGYKPVLVGPQPFSFEEILRNVDPAPDEETERFKRLSTQTGGSLPRTPRLNEPDCRRYRRRLLPLPIGTRWRRTTPTHCMSPS